VALRATARRALACQAEAAELEVLDVESADASPHDGLGEMPQACGQGTSAGSRGARGSGRVDGLEPVVDLENRSLYCG
jgi:hypothetical protein